jgi:hypothetical protein
LQENHWNLPSGTRRNLSIFFEFLLPGCSAIPATVANPATPARSVRPAKPIKKAGGVATAGFFVGKQYELLTP